MNPRLAFIVALLGAAPVLAPAAAPAAAKERAPERGMLERYRPLLRYDAQEEYFAQPVSLPPETAEVVPGDRVYGHLAREGEDRWLQYWLFYAYNPQDRGIFRTGRHEGDWELVQLRVGDDGEPDLATLTQHSWAEGCAWGELELTNRGGKPVPELYVANGSHATYSAPGTHDRPFPDPNDEADGDGRAVRPAVVPIDDRHPAWVAYEGPWGTTEAGFIPGESPSPTGPRFQRAGAWDHPSTFHRDLARPCGSGPPGRWWQTAIVVALAMAVVGMVARGLRRRIGSR